MKRRLIKHGIAVLGIVALATLSISTTKSTPQAPVVAPVSSGSAPATGVGTVTIVNQGLFSEQVQIPVKDFEGVGLVFTESKYQYNTGNSSIIGNMFTYQALLKEAQRQRADAIINVVIDKKVERVMVDNVWLRQETWYGSALAIRYTGIVNPAEIAISKARSYTFSGNIGLTSATTIGQISIANQGIFGEQIYIPVKNFESAGLVFIEVEYELDTFQSTISGDVFTYYSLLKEAEKARGHAIINVTIDKKLETAGNKRKEKWYASALAIRYTTNVPNSDRVKLNEARSFTGATGTPFGK